MSGEGRVFQGEGQHKQRLKGNNHPGVGGGSVQALWCCYSVKFKTGGSDEGKVGKVLSAVISPLHLVSGRLGRALSSVKNHAVVSRC